MSEWDGIGPDQAVSQRHGNLLSEAPLEREKDPNGSPSGTERVERTGWPPAAVGSSSIALKGVSVSGDTAVDSFYRDVLHELGEFARRPSATAIGAAVVVKRVAMAHGVQVAERVPLPRFSRAEREDRAEVEWRVKQ